MAGRAAPRTVFLLWLLVWCSLPGGVPPLVQSVKLFYSRLGDAPSRRTGSSLSALNVLQTHTFRQRLPFDPPTSGRVAGDALSNHSRCPACQRRAPAQERVPTPSEGGEAGTFPRQRPRRRVLSALERAPAAVQGRVPPLPLVLPGGCFQGHVGGFGAPGCALTPVGKGWGSRFSACSHSS